MLAEQAAKQRAAEMNQRFLEALRKALLGLDPDDPDVRAILERVVPKLLAASGAALAWENFVSFMKGGKDAVKKTTAGEAKPRLGTSGYKGGSKWTDLKPVNTPETTRQIGKINKQAFGGGEVRTDGEYVFRFDPAHKTAKVHMERYKKIRNNHWRADAEIDPNTGDIIAGSNEKLAKKKYIRDITW